MPDRRSFLAAVASSPLAVLGIAPPPAGPPIVARHLLIDMEPEKHTYYVERLSNGDLQLWVLSEE